MAFIYICKKLMLFLSPHIPCQSNIVCCPVWLACLSWFEFHCTCQLLQMSNWHWENVADSSCQSSKPWTTWFMFKSSYFIYFLTWKYHKCYINFLLLIISVFSTLIKEKHKNVFECTLKISLFFQPFLPFTLSLLLPPDQLWFIRWFIYQTSSMPASQLI